MRIELTLADLKRFELGILDYIDKVCKENEIIYYIDSGTLLGAVRHKGFIPWDDDIDIIVNRQDYKKLLSLLAEGSTRYQVLSMYNNENYHYLFAKVIDAETELIEDYLPMEEMGVFVDIFPIDNLPSNIVVRRIMQYYIRLKRTFLRIILDEINGKKTETFKQKLVLFIHKRRNWKKIMNTIDSLLTKMSAKETKYKSNIVASSNPYRDVPTEYFGDPVQLQFENSTYYAPCAYKEYLTILYGDYMTLPPESARVTNHSFKAYMRMK